MEMRTRPRDVSPREGAQELGIRLDSLYSLIWAKKLPAIKRDGKWWIPFDAIEERKKNLQSR
jgi:hypothetical protein